jgi:hypothetical protein
LGIEGFDDKDKAEAGRKECERRADHIAAALYLALGMIATDARHLMLIALYNRERDPDGSGGTAHLVYVAAKWGYKTVALDARKLLKS